MNFPRLDFAPSAWIILVLLAFTSCKAKYSLVANLAENKAIDHSIVPDSNIVQYYSPYKQELERRMNQQIGMATHALIRNRNIPETLASNFFAEAMLHIGRSIDPEVLISIGTKDGIRTDINKGPVTIGNIFEFMPFENFFVILDISGHDFLELCEFIAKTQGQPIAGFRMKIKDGKPFDIDINGKPFDINTRYKIVTYDYLADGGDHIKGLSTPIHRRDTDIRVREGLIDYIKKATEENKPIHAQIDGRVTIIE